jgi:hypothetical protein
MKIRIARRFAAVYLMTASAACSVQAAADCSSSALGQVAGIETHKLADGGFAAFAKMNINIDGYGRAYHLKNAEGSLIHLCNAGRVYKPDGSVYEGSESNATCTGRFMRDVAAIEAAGWNDPAVGVVQWYGLLGTGSATIKGKKIEGVVPVLQNDTSGFAVSPTALADTSVADAADQSRYVNPLRIPAAVVPAALIRRGVALGSFGVAYNTRKGVAVPFVVGDAGPRIGEGSVALARLAAGLPLKEDIKKPERYAGQVDGPDVLWIFFGGDAAPFDSHQDSASIEKAKVAFDAWGGDARLAACVGALPRR